MKTMLPNGRIEGAQPANRAIVRVTTTSFRERQEEPPCDVTTVWRDGEVWRKGNARDGRARLRPAIRPVLG